MGIYAGLYWGPGEGPSGEAAADAIWTTWGLIQRTTGVDQWRELGMPSAEPIAWQDIGRLLERGANRDDGAGLPIESLGRRLAVWDGVEGSFSAAVGGTGSRWTGNCLIKVPGLPASADEAWPIMRELIDIWHPAWGTWATSDIRALGREAGLPRGRPPLGLLTWVRADIMSPFIGVGAVTVDGGTLYRFGDHVDDVSEATARAVIVPVV